VDGTFVWRRGSAYPWRVDERGHRRRASKKETSKTTRAPLAHLNAIVDGLLADTG
jgi:hypothetical protein